MEDVAVVILGIVTVIFFGSASILLLKLNSFADLHSSDREAYRKRYLFLGLCMGLVAMSTLIGFCFSIPLILSAFYENPEVTVICTAFDLLSHVLSSLGIILMLQPGQTDTSSRSTSKVSKSNKNSQKEKFGRERADEPMRENEFISMEFNSK